MNEKEESHPILAVVGLILVIAMTIPVIDWIADKNTQQEHALRAMRTSCIGVLVMHNAPSIASDDINITMPCGNVFRIRKGELFPINDIPCPCGDTSHWLFKRKQTQENL